MSNTPNTATSPANTVKVRLLKDCDYGQCNDVVLIDQALVPGYSGELVDASPEAIAYAESLKP